VNLKVIPSFLSVLSTQEKTQLEGFNLELKNLSHQNNIKVLDSFFLKKKEANALNNENLKISFDFFFFFSEKIIYIIRVSFPETDKLIVQEYSCVYG